MGNIVGPNQESGKLLMWTTISIIRAEIWAAVVKKITAALRVASAYQTLSGDAILVISVNAPNDLLAYERKKL